jgi:hypothetical protein
VEGGEALDGGVVEEDVRLGFGPVAVECGQEGLGDDVEERQDDEFVEYDEDEHGVREGGRQSVLGQPQPVLEDEHDAPDAEGHAHADHPDGQEELHCVAEVDVTGREVADPAHLRVEDRNADVGEDVHELDCCHDEVVGGQSEGMLAGLYHRVPVVLLLLHYFHRVHRNGHPGSHEQFALEVVLALLLPAAIVQALVDPSLAGGTLLFLDLYLLLLPHAVLCLFDQLGAVLLVNLLNILCSFVVLIAEVAFIPLVGLLEGRASQFILCYSVLGLLFDHEVVEFLVLGQVVEENIYEKSEFGLLTVFPVGLSR